MITSWHQFHTRVDVRVEGVPEVFGALLWWSVYTLKPLSLIWEEKHGFPYMELANLFIAQ